MLCECPDCRTSWSRYSAIAEPCPHCGQTKLLFWHLCSNFKDNHQILIDIESNEVLSDDPCKNLKE